MKKVVLWIIIAVVIIGGAFAYFNRGSEKEYETEEAKIGTLTQTVSVTGSISPLNEVDLYPETSGKLESFNVEVGDVVQEGEYLGKVNDSILQSQLQEALVTLSIKEEQEKLARRNWDALKPEEKKVKKETTESARASVRTIQKQLENNKIHAPLSGTVVSKNRNVGEVVNPSISLGKIASKEDYKIESFIPESDIANIEPGQSAQVTFDAFSMDEKFEAKISKIDPAATVIQDVVYYKSELVLETENKRIKPGMSVDIDIRTAKKEGVLMIPERAVVTEEEGRSVQILVDKEQGLTETKEVQTGFSGDDGMIEIISGLKEGDQIVTFTK